MSLLKEYIALMLERREQPQPVDVVVSSLKKRVDEVIRSHYDEYLDVFAGFLGLPKEKAKNAADSALEQQVPTWFSHGKTWIKIKPSGLSYRELSHVDGFNEALNDVFKNVRNFGWFVLIEAKSRGTAPSWYLSPNYGTRADVPEALYHVTNIENVDRILRKGLLPSTGRSVQGFNKRNIPNRVYLATTLLAAGQFLEAFEGKAGGYDVGTGEFFVILKVDTTKLSKGTKFFIDDEEPKRSVWTYSRIPPEAIELDENSKDAYKEYKLHTPA